MRRQGTVYGPNKTPRPRRVPTGGFSLIELMIAIAIIGILIAAAIPRYQIYTQRSKVSASLAMARTLQLAVAEYAALHARLPPDAGALAGYGVAAEGQRPASGPVASVRYLGGESPSVVLRFRDDPEVPKNMRDKTLYIDVALNDFGTVSFSVGEAGSLPAELRPRL